MPRLPPKMPDLPPGETPQPRKRKVALPPLPPIKPPEHEAKVETPYYDFSALAGLDELTQQQVVDDAAAVVGELAKRRREALKLYEPLPSQNAFHRSKARTRLCRGGNRAGKTLPSAVEVARAALRQDPHDKYRSEGIVYIVGDDYTHHGETVFPKLFKPGAFLVIRDAESNLWRAFRPWSPADWARKDQARPSEPLIPWRMVKDVSWHKKNEEIPSVIQLKTGWRLNFFSGKGDPPQGAMVDIVWLDEEIPNRKWFPEMNSRIADRDGCIIWSATPQNGTVELYDLSQAAAAQADWRYREVEEFVMRLADNAHMPEKAKREMASNLSDEERRVRIEGEFAIAGQIIYREFSPFVHGIAMPGGVPNTWTNYAVVDPGHQVCAVLFAAVPPPSEVDPADYDLLLWGELYLEHSNSGKFGDAMAKVCEGRNFEAFIIDTHGSRVTEAGSGKTIYEQYKTALATRNVASAKSGSGFIWGSDLRQDGVNRVRDYLQVRRTGTPRLRILTDYGPDGTRSPVLPNFEREIARYRYKRDAITGLPTDEPEDRGATHLMACLRYLIQYGPKYVRPTPAIEHMDPVLRAFFKEQREGRRDGVPRVTVFGPARGAVR